MSSHQRSVVMSSTKDIFDTPEVRAARARLVKSLEELLPEDREQIRRAARTVTPERRAEIAKEATEASEKFREALMTVQRKKDG